MNGSLGNLLLTFCFLFLLVGFTHGQSSFEYGLGLGINHSSIKEDIRTTSSPISSQKKGIRLLALNVRVGYKMSDLFHINFEPGISWLGSFQKDISARDVASTFEVPLLLEMNVSRNIHLTSGPVYNYIAGFKSENEQMEFNLLPGIKTRNQFGLRHGVAFSHEEVELSLSYTHYLTEVFNISFTDVNGNFLGTLVSKFGNIQLGVIYRK